MPLVPHIVCDNCQVVEILTKHCYAVTIESNRFSVKPLALTAGWETKCLPDSSLQYFCGRSCAVEALTRWMNKLYDETLQFAAENTHSNGADSPRKTRG